MADYIPTGNERISLPKINAATAGIEDFTFLSMQHRGMLEVRGSEEVPLIRPFVEINGVREELRALHWSRACYWLPNLTARIGQAHFQMTILPPLEERGFAIRLELTASASAKITWGLEGCWQSSWHCVNEDKQLEGSQHCYGSGWNNSVIFDFRCGAPMFAFAPMSSAETKTEFAQTEGGITYCLRREEIVEDGKSTELIFYWGLGYEEVAAATSAKEMLRRGWAWEYQKTCAWLQKRTMQLQTSKLTELYNTNLFFCIFFSTGRTLDTEELVCATSRSTRYYVSAAYWDRDVLLWAFPAILDADQALAREILDYVFGRQRRNLGVHSRFIDGTVLEPGFELDELVAPVIALASYIHRADDRSILQDRDVLAGIREILKKLQDCRHPDYPLYETFLQPTDDEIVYPYLTYDNVLVWKAFRELAACCPECYSSLEDAAERVKDAIYRHCVFHDEQGKAYFSWSVDLQGNHNVYDEPPGSLQLLPYYGFCSADDPIWCSTVARIRSPEYAYSFAQSPISEIGCAHAPYPWILSLGNSMLCGYAEKAWQELELLKMDNGIACESVDPDTGVCTTGAAFATCAGFLCHCMKWAYKEGHYGQ